MQFTMKAFCVSLVCLGLLLFAGHGILSRNSEAPAGPQPCCAAADPFEGPLLASAEPEPLGAGQAGAAQAGAQKAVERAAEKGAEKNAQKSTEKSGEKTAAEKEKKSEALDPSIGGLKNADPKATGAIAGRVVLKGELPEMKPLAVEPSHKDRAVCGAEIPYERHIFGPDNAVKNAVMALAKVPGAPKPAPRKISLDNQRCRFVPHVQATTQGSVLRITSQDKGVLHSAMGVMTNTFNVAISSPEQVIEQKLNRPGQTPIKCSTHGWMEAHVWVFPHEFFAVTSIEGKYRIEGIPPGKYEVKLVHEGLDAGDKPLEVTVEAGKTTELIGELKVWE